MILETPTPWGLPSGIHATFKERATKLFLVHHQEPQHLAKKKEKETRYLSKPRRAYFLSSS